MKSFIRSTLSSLFYFANLLRRRGGIVVLMYHRINDDLPPNDLVTPVKVFKKQMQYLRDHHDVIDLKKFIELMNAYLSGEPPAGRHMVITFDDGYRDNYLHAFPILREYVLPATIFLTTGMISTDKKRPRYQHMPDPDMLNWEEVKTMAQSGISFGAHTDSHPHLSQLSYAEQKLELSKSINTLIEKFSLSRDSAERLIFCYPYGDYNQDTLKIMKELGIKIAFTVKPGINSRPILPLELRRTEINGIDTLFDFKKKLGGGFDWLHGQIQSAKARRTRLSGHQGNPGLGDQVIRRSGTK